MDLGPLLALAGAIIKALAAFFWPKKENPDETALKAKEDEIKVMEAPGRDKSAIIASMRERERGE